MSPIPGLRRYFRLPLTRATVERDVDDEVQFHIAMRIDDLVAAGCTRDEAETIAHREFGDVRAAQAELSRLGQARVRRARRADMRDVIGRDLHHGVRMLVREPGFAIAVILTLAIGLGVNAVMFGITDRLLFRAPPGVHESDDVARVYFRATLESTGPLHYPVTTWPQYENLRAVPVIADAGVVSGRDYASYGTGRDARSVRVVLATGSLFTTLRARPSVGRFFTDAESRDGSAVAVVSAPFWKRELGGAGIEDRRIRIGAREYQVVGVAEPGFTGADLEPVDVWLPIATAGAEFGGDGWNTERMQWLRIFVRQRDDVAPAAAAQALGVAARESDFIMAIDSASTVTLEPLPAARVAGTAQNATTAANSRVALWLSGVSLFVLLIACANVANLLLARAVRRRREIGVRLALGMGRRRMATQLMTETLVLAVIGAGAALLLAHWSGTLLRTVLLPDVEWAGRPVVDGRLLAFAGAALLVTVLLAGLAPALYAVRDDVVGALGLGSRSGVRRSRLRTGLVVAQTALSIVLLAGAAMFVTSLRNAHRIDIGLDTANLAAVRWNEGSLEMPPAERSALYDETLRRVRLMPQVVGAAMAAHAPLMSSSNVSVATPGRTLPENDDNAGINAVSPDYLQVTGTPLLRGRNFSAQDAAGGERVALVSESLARHLWPDGDGLGECLQYTSDGECLRVVGVIRGMRSPAPGAEEARMFLVPLAQAPTLRSERVLLVRTRAGERAALQQAVQTVRPGLAHVQVEPYSAVLEPMVWPWRLGARLFTAFGAIALILAAVGLYGIVAYDVTQREPEMSVRIALGAQRDAIARLIMGDAGRMILTGAAIGVGITWFVGPRLQALLFDVSGRDPRLLAVACIVLAAAGLGAAAVPAWRASRADPMRAMKEA